MESIKEPTTIVSPRRKILIGYGVFFALVAIKVVEYSLSKIIKVGDWPYLLVLAIGSAVLIIYFYKHINQLWAKGSGN